MADVLEQLLDSDDLSDRLDAALAQHARGVPAAGPLCTTELPPRGVASNESAELFRLQRTRIPLQNLSASLVFTFLFPERWWGRAGIGIGTSILFASGGGPFQQFTAIVLHVRSRRPGATADPLLRATTMVSPTAAPGVMTQISAEMVATLGVAINLSVIADAVASLFNNASSTKLGSK